MSSTYRRAPPQSFAPRPAWGGPLCVLSRGRLHVYCIVLNIVIVIIMEGEDGVWASAFELRKGLISN